jgi:hypothetical protein
MRLCRVKMSLASRKLGWPGSFSAILALFPAQTASHLSASLRDSILLYKHEFCWETIWQGKSTFISPIQL